MSEYVGIAISDFFLALVTKYYLEDVRKHDTRIVSQIEYAKALNKPTVLAICKELSENEQKEVETIFQHHNVIGKVFFERNDRPSIEQAVLEMKQIVDEWERKK